MKILQRPILMTILFGIFCGISLVPLHLVLSAIFYRPSAISLTIWSFSAGYAFFLSLWSKNKVMPILFPLLVLLATAFLVKSIAAFFFMALAVISWIRSGICFQEHGAIKLVVELLLCVAAGVLITVFTPGSAFGWALGIWMFFLMQAVYFAIFDIKTATPSRKYEQAIDPFERASQRAEDILSSGGIC